ncbi:M16 family metallopeptidase [Clostridium perfringens]|uniref:M16 family metallopeptidase n=1 Tax=Clostridium perfringens TaxID=1502 RepID=UPI0009933678|nr:pitrilysin family protein [Clostridium perfringens]AQW24613.1 peptidase M16 [Clostridium perfringens]EHK2336597.1 insulinase family protein [Clostridium perfringens]MDH2339655.1 pitrilysin family protein [Clostridium perfringens]HAT4247764.1 insulinase family protein [Clostridium perfringens]HDI3012922.1 insulinase family protein [Clostridium perfringens]
MQKIILNNGVRLLYKFKDIEHTSFCISLESGANAENKDEIGMAHALEHILFKGNEKLKEDEINEKLDDLFGFNNAMTNFPYVIYYGTTAKEDFEEGFSLYSDIVLNSDLQEFGFSEELNVIKQESDEWKEDLEQHVEDLALMNGLPAERIGNLIIGEKNHIEAISFQGLKDFYEKSYLSENMIVSVVSSLSLEEVKEIVEKNFNRAKRGKISKYSLERNINCGIFSKKIEGNTGAKICCLFDINNLSMEEVTLLKVFNLWFGEGVSSVLYDEIRTKNGLAYEVYSEVKYEKGIRLFKIYLGTSKEKEEEALGLIEKCISKAMDIEDYLSEEGLNKLIKRFKLKNSLDLEKSIVLANRMAIYETMFDRGEYIFEELNLVENLSLKDMKNLIKRVLKKSIVQIIN